MDDALKRAAAFHQAGRLAEADALYQQVLAQQPNDAAALHGAGVVALQNGRFAEAVELIGRAVAISPSSASYHMNLGVALHKLTRLDDAIAAYRTALGLHWNNPKALTNLAEALRTQGKLDEAVAAAKQALVLSPRQPEGHQSLGLALLDKGQFEQALTAFKQAVFLRPDSPDAHLNLGGALFHLGRYDEAASAFKRSVSLRPADAKAHNSLGGALLKADHFEEAVAFLQRAIELEPNLPEAHANLGAALMRLGRRDEAAEALTRALSLRPDYAEAHNNLGVLRYQSGDLEAAAEEYQSALKLRPDYAMAHWNLGVILMLRGDFEQGWSELEWGSQWQANPRRRELTQPLWDGSDLAGRRLLIHAEQGFGDAIQFIRYLPRVCQAGGKVIVAVQKELHRLFASLVQVEKWIAPNEPLPSHDVRCPLMSLPHIFKTNLSNIPADIPYLRAEESLAAPWRNRMANIAGRKIGLAWAGRPKDTNDLDRSLNLSQLASLAQVPGITFFSLQKGEAALQAANPPRGMNLVDWTADLHDFADTAALIANLELVIAVDTVVAHLAGAMGKPVWLLLQHTPDWRWMLARTDSPWYPTMRLFRQQQRGDWKGPIGQIVEAIAEGLNSDRGL
ncbi:MAG: tetratricopeptide repeat protein [Tepidisphaeraceae bacterium]|jgi:Flp pilus assembly protein TadD